MANYKRGYPRSQHSGTFGLNKWEAKRLGDLWNWTASNPRWWDLVFHIRPKRREGNRVTKKVFLGQLEADEAVWPLGCKKPTQYYW